jgi:hypothetical protein
LRFLSIEIVGIASPRDASTSPMIWLQSIGWIERSSERKRRFDSRACSGLFSATCTDSWSSSSHFLRHAWMVRHGPVHPLFFLDLREKFFEKSEIHRQSAVLWHTVRRTHGPSV